MDNTNNMTLTDNAISHIAKLVQVAILTGTDVVDNLRMAKFINVNGTLEISPEYHETFDLNIERMLQNATSETVKDQGQRMTISKSPDRLNDIFALREEFMSLINEKVPEAYPESWPVDLSIKSNQKAIRELAFRGMEELFEALLHLKNWKDHRAGEDSFDRSEFPEEMIDAHKYFTAILVLMGVDSNEFFNAYVSKHNKICDRLRTTQDQSTYLNV